RRLSSRAETFRELPPRGQPAGDCRLYQSLPPRTAERRVVRRLSESAGAGAGPGVAEGHIAGGIFLMSRRVGFYLPRANYLKVMGPLIDYIASTPAASYRAVLLLPRWQTSKPQLRIDADALRRLCADRVDIV